MILSLALVQTVLHSVAQLSIAVLGKHTPNYKYVCWQGKWEIFTVLIIHSEAVVKKNQLDVTFCILYFSSNSCSTCFEQPCAHHQELTTA
jgi:hypothetical protein